MRQRPKFVAVLEKLLEDFDVCTKFVEQLLYGSLLETDLDAVDLGSHITSARHR